MNLLSRLKSMLKVDFRRMLTTPLFYIMVGSSLVMPILILVMTTLMDGTVTVNPNTGVETVIEGFDNAWQIIASRSDANMMEMGLTTMVNMNLLYFMSAVFVCLFVAEDFRSGYAKNLFTVHAKKSDYVISKTLAGITCGMLMIIAFFIGTLIGGKIAGLPFDLGDLNVGNLIMCMLSKLFLVAVFVPIFLVMSVVGKQRLWLSLVIAMGASMLLFTMIPMICPLDSTIMNVILALAGGTLFSVGIGAISNLILNKTSLV